MVKNLASNAGHRRCGFNPWVGKIPWRRAWQPTPVFSPGKSHGQEVWQAAVHGVATVNSDDAVMTGHTPVLHFTSFYMKYFIYSAQQPVHERKLMLSSGIIDC